MWLSASGQTATILAATSTATRSHVIGARRTAVTTTDRQAAARTKGATHQTSSGRSSRMMAVSARTESGTPSSSRAGRRSRVHTVDEIANAARGRGERLGRVLDPPRLDADRVHLAAVPILAIDDATRQPGELGVR